MEQIELSFMLNGKAVRRTVALDARLLDVLRYDCASPGTKEGCGEGECGACSVIMDGLLVNSCLVPAFQAEGRSIETVESSPVETMAILNRTGTSQCGACTPGVVMSIRWLLEHPELASKVDLHEYMSGNLCRCTGYGGIINGVREAMQHHEITPRGQS